MATKVCLAAWVGGCVTSLVLAGTGNVLAQDTGNDTTPVVRLVAGEKLVPPAEAANQDASGSVKLLQWGERIAIHVKVRKLEAGATYGVFASRTDTEGNATEVSVGSITTHDGAPSAPRCYKAVLAAPEPVEEDPVEEPGEDPAVGGDGAGSGHHGGGWGWWPPRKPKALAVLNLNRESTELSYQLPQRAIAEGAETVIVFADASELPLPLGEKGRGSVEVTEAQVTALSSGETDLVVRTPGATPEEAATVLLSGDVTPCFPWLDDFRQDWSARRAGQGALKLDTSREDAVPFDVTTIQDLLGVTFSVKDAESAVVLAGTIEEIHDCTPPVEEDPVEEEPATGGDGGGAAVPEEEIGVLSLAGNEVFFDLSEKHDASFVRGDANADGSVDISDPLFILSSLFRGSAVPYCADSADANDSGTVDVSDAITVLGYLFQSTGNLPAPAGVRGFDPTVDGLYCGANP